MIKVIYATKTGNTEKIAKAIAEQLSVAAEGTSTPITEDTDILFIGSGVYFGMLSGKVKKFIRDLDATKVKKVVLFGTAGAQNKSIVKMQNLLAAKNIPVAENTLLITIGHGDHKSITPEDLQKAKDFAQASTY